MFKQSPARSFLSGVYKHICAVKMPLKPLRQKEVACFREIGHSKAGHVRCLECMTSNASSCNYVVHGHFLN